MLVFYYFFLSGGMFFDMPLEHPLYKETPPKAVFYAEPCKKPKQPKNRHTPRAVGDTIFVNKLAADGYSNDGGQWVVLKSIEQ